MGFNCHEFAIRVSGLGEAWFVGPHPVVEAKLFPGHTPEQISWMGGESVIIETIGLGGFAQAAAFPLQSYQGGSAEAMVANNLAMYDIVVGEHSDFRIPFLAYRGTPTGIDVLKVVETGANSDHGYRDCRPRGRPDRGRLGAGAHRLLRTRSCSVPARL